MAKLQIWSFNLALVLSAVIPSILSKTINYEIVKNQHLTTDDTNGTVSHYEKNVTSTHHCALLCTVTPGCVSANYDSQMSICQLINHTRYSWPQKKTGSSAIIRAQSLGGS